jgi:ubiquinone/menaquinone biosynthesis C-methylase UbiE
MSGSSYEQQAEVYDLIYTQARGKDYLEEARKIRAIIQAGQHSHGHSLLDVACGTGLHDQYLARWYEVTGLDLSAAQLTIARRRLPKLTFHQANMIDFRLDRKFDTVTCLFSAIGHALTLSDMRQAIATMVSHVLPGGLLIVEPWLHPDQYRPGVISTDVVRSDEIDVVRMVMSELREERISQMAMHHLVGRPGQGVHHFVEDVDAAMYTIEEYLDAFRVLGLEVRHDRPGLTGRGLFIGRKALG